MKTTELTSKEMVKGALKNAKESANEKLKEKAPIITGIKYDPKKIKVVFSKELTAELSAYYAVKMQLFRVARVYQNNIKVYQNRIDNIMSKDVVTEDDINVINNTQREILKSQVCYKFFKSKINKELKPILTLITDSLYEAHIKRFENEEEFKEELTMFLKSVNVTLTDSLYAFVDKCIGAKSASSTKLNKCVIDNLGKGAFKKLILDILLQLALDKSALSKTVIEETLSDTDVTDIKEFNEITLVERPTYKTTVKDYKRIFDEVGVPYVGLKSKEDFLNAYKKALRDGLFAEI